MENKELETQDTVMTPDVYRKHFGEHFLCKHVFVLNVCKMLVLLT